MASDSRDVHVPWQLMGAVQKPGTQKKLTGHIQITEINRFEADLAAKKQEFEGYTPEVFSRLGWFTCKIRHFQKGDSELGGLIIFRFHVKLGGGVVIQSP